MAAKKTTSSAATATRGIAAAETLQRIEADLAPLAFPQPHLCFEEMEIADSEAFEWNLLLRLRA